MSSDIKAPKKLIEVALPLDDINNSSSIEKSIRAGHPSTTHLWWSRKPLATSKAVLFAQLVNDPGRNRGYFSGKTKDQADLEREKLFEIIRDLVKWEKCNDETILTRARNEIVKSWEETCELNNFSDGFDPSKLPRLLDPFCGGGSIPLEAQRLGLKAVGRDLNPVAVILTKSLIEVANRFVNQEPIGPAIDSMEQGNLLNDWPGTKGIAEDVRRFGHIFKEMALQKLAHLYPKVEITKELINEQEELKDYEGQSLEVLCWIWVRTIKSPNPAFSHVEIPLSTKWVLSKKNCVWVEPEVHENKIEYRVKKGKKIPEEANHGTKLSQGSFKCFLSGTPFKYEHIDNVASSEGLGARLIAVVAKGKKGRVYLSPTKEMEDLANSASPNWFLDVPCRGTFASNAQGRRYGFNFFGDYFTKRQMAALSVFCDLVTDLRDEVKNHALDKGLSNDETPLDQGGVGAYAYAEAISVYIALAIDRLAMSGNSLCRWNAVGEKVQHSFGQQGIAMIWEYAETNFFASATGSIDAAIKLIADPLALLPASTGSVAMQSDAMCNEDYKDAIVSTDPPYYDNVLYSDLSDFFYVWLRKSLREIYPSVFSTITTPKSNELVVVPSRHESQDAADNFFLEGMTEALSHICGHTHPAFPVTIYYAFKQADTKEIGTASTGWETFLEAVIRAGFTITGTWPMRTEMKTRQVAMDSNALASSLVLVCRPRELNAESISRRQFQKALRQYLPESLEIMIGGSLGQSPIAPVDLAQAAIGPGMEIYSKYEAILNQDGSRMSVHDALILINRAITEYLSPESGSFDSDTQFCSGWFDQYGWNAGPFGEADTLSRAKGTSVDGVKKSGVIESGGGKVRLMKWEEYPSNWDPTTDDRMPVWEACHHLIRALNKLGETEAGKLLARMPEKGEQIRQLAYHLYTLCERKKWTDEARAYNELITSWHGIVESSHATGHKGSQTSWIEE